MIDFREVEKRFGTQTVLDRVSFRVNAGERVGIVGPNGAGKSTVFRLLCREMEADGGEVLFPKNCRFGHLRQQLNAHERGELLIDYTRDAVPELKTIAAALAETEHVLSERPDDEAALRRLGELQQQFEHLGGYEMKSRAEAALCGLGFDAAALERPFSSFSGGWQMRAELARVLIAQPDVLLLDEPSNYLDLPAVEWLERFLRSYHGTMLLISHDRYLLRSLTDRTLEIAGGDAVKYQGGYDYYLQEREQRREQQAAAYRNYVQRKEQTESFVRRFRAKSTKASQVQSRVKMLEKMEEVKPPPAAPDLSYMRIGDPPHCGAKVLELSGAGFAYTADKWIFREVDLEINRGEKVAVTGFNGMGKTTLLRLLAGTLKPCEGRVRLGHKVVIGYQSQEFAETMPPASTVLGVVKNSNPEVSEREVRTLLGSFGFSGDAVDKPVRVLSGGEKIRLAFARIFINPPNLLILDEPTTHLDIAGREALEEAVRNYKGTVCLVSHDVTFVRNTAERIVAMTPPGVSCFAGGYDYYLEKIEQNPVAGARIEKADAAAEKEVVPEKGKDARRARAQQREAQKALRDMEKELERMQLERDALIGKMNAGGEEIDYPALGIELNALTGKIVELETRWLEEAEETGW